MAEPEKDKVREVSLNELPLCCPAQDADPAGLHPRVYIPLKKVGVVEACPYCSRRFALKG